MFPRRLGSPPRLERRDMMQKVGGVWLMSVPVAVAVLWGLMQTRRACPCSLRAPGGRPRRYRRIVGRSVVHQGLIWPPRTSQRATIAGVIDAKGLLASTLRFFAAG